MTFGTLTLWNGRTKYSAMNDDEIPLDPEDEVPTYDVDDGTLELLEVALNCLVSLSEVQFHEEARLNLVTIADEIAARFGISAGVIETTTEDGETILRPRGGVFGDEDEDNTPGKLGPSIN